MSEPLIQECATCGALIDVSDEEPLSLIHCPTCGAAMRARRVFGNFELLEILGAGGMGSVYRAHDTTLNRSVALKLLRREYSTNPEFIRQFAHEAALTALINHPNVVKVYSTGSDHDLFYIAMELVDKGSLDDLMGLQGRVAESQVLTVGIQAALGLRAAFQRGLIHRDVKPGNILFSDASHAKIVDFGLAAPMDSAGGVAGEIWGTPYYVAPEKLENPPMEDCRSDIYSLGATLFHALAGRPPYEADDASLVALKHLKSKPVSLQAFAPDVSSGTSYVINKTLHKDPKQRHQSYDELIQHLEYARSQLTGNKATRAAGRVKKRVVIEDTSNQRAMSFVTLIMLGVLAYGGYFAYQNRDMLRDRLFPQPEKRQVSATKKARQAAAAIKPKYEAARKLLIAGKYEEAASAFHALEADGNVAQPMLDWITFHSAISLTLAGKADQAKADFDELKKRGPFSHDPYEQQIADFFTKISGLMIDDNAPTPESVEGYRKEDFQAIAFLALGLKAWETGEFENGLTILRQFESTTPEPPYDWISDYRPIVEAYVASYDKFKDFSEEVKKVGEPENAKKELPKLKEELASLNLKGRLAKKGRQLLRKVEQDIEEADAEEKKAVAEMEASDDKALTEVKAKLNPLVQTFKFKEALVEAKGAQPVTDKGKADKAGLMKKMDWLVGFKSQLTQDLGANPYTAGVPRKEGLPVPYPISDADDAGLIAKAGPTTVPIPWTTVTFEGLYTMAKSYLKPDLPPDRLADRMWMLGVYCETVGKTKEAAELFDEAVKKKPDYEKEWQIFPDVPKPSA